MLGIKLMRMGNKHRPYYRIVVKERRTKRDGKYIEMIGYYDPLRAQQNYEINIERYNYWLKKGAIPSETVRSLFKKMSRMSAQ
jgi:small subunit ribosomal protein S16